MAIPTPHDFAASEFVNDTTMDSGVRDPLNYLLSPPHVKVYRSANASIANITWVLVAGWDSEEYDDPTRPSHSTSTNPSRLIAPEDGVYQLIWECIWAAATGQRTLKWKKNAADVDTAGTLIVQQQIDATGGGATTSEDGAVETALNAGDYLQMFIFQNSGGAVNMIGGVGNSFASWRWVSKI
jgi:hypothetical protein